VRHGVGRLDIRVRLGRGEQAGRNEVSEKRNQARTMPEIHSKILLRKQYKPVRLV
jgi:hypothetical protein